MKPERAQCAYVFAVILLAAHAVAAQRFNATVVRVAVPDSVPAGTAFEFTAVLRNTGSATWSPAVDNDSTVRLVSVSPERNTTWGTSFIISGQGRTGVAGDTFAFVSNLKAPATPGRYAFAWRAAQQVLGQFFGDTIRHADIVVTANARQCPSPPVRDSVLTLADFEYTGSFKVPTVQSYEARYTESGLALRRLPDGTTRLFMNTGTYEHALYEAEVPAGLVKFTSVNKDSLPVAQVKRVWGEIRFPNQYAGETISLNAGFHWDESTKRLFWSYYHGYKAGEAPPVLGICRLDSATGAVSYRGPWYVPTAQAGWYKAYWGGVTTLSQRFAARYTQGRTLALGFGGYYSVCGTATRGPALAAMASPDTLRDSLQLTEMLTYRGQAIAPRDGDYFSANCSYWNEPPINSECGRWSFADHSRSGVLIDLPGTQAFVAFTWMGTGRLGYDYGSITTGGNSHYWYFYDSRELGEAALGRIQPYDIKPVSMHRVVYPGNNQHATAAVSGAVFDTVSRRLYLYHPFCIDDLEPAVHVYTVRQSGAVHRGPASARQAPLIEATARASALRVRCEGFTGAVQVSVFALDGREVAARRNGVSSGEGLLVFTGLAPASYVVTARSGTAVTVTRAVVR